MNFRKLEYLLTFYRPTQRNPNESDSTGPPPILLQVQNDHEALQVMDDNKGLVHEEK